MSILEIIAHHIWDDNYPLSRDARQRVTSGRIRDFERCYPKIWSRKAKDLSDLRGEYGACKFLLKRGSKYSVYRQNIIDCAAMNGDIITVEQILESIMLIPHNRRAMSRYKAKGGFSDIVDRYCSVSYLEHADIEALDSNITIVRPLLQTLFNYRRSVSIHGAKGGHLDIVQKYCVKTNLYQESNEAAKYNHINVLNWCIAIMGKNLKPSNIAEAAATGGHLDLVKMAIRLGARNYARIATIAAENGHLEIVKRFDGQHKQYTNVLLAAAGNGHFNVIDYVSKKIKMNVGVFRQIVSVAANKGQADVFMRYVDDANIDNYSLYVESAVHGGNIQIVKYIFDQFDYLNGDTLLRDCAKYGYLDIMKLVYDKCDGVVINSTHLTHIAATNNNLEILEYLYDLGYPILMYEAERAAYSGHLRIVEFMVENGATNYHEIHDAAKHHYQYIVDYISPKITKKTPYSNPSATICKSK